MINIKLNHGKSNTTIDGNIDWIKADVIVGIPTAIESILDEICTSEAEKRDIMKQFTGELKNKKLIDDDL